MVGFVVWEEEEVEDSGVVGRSVLQEGHWRVLRIVEDWSSRHCQWKWHEQGSSRSSGTVSDSWRPSSPESASSGSRERMRGSSQALQVAILECVGGCFGTPFSH